jgi:D-glycerate 3-kinase
MVDQLIMLQAPSFDTVFDWRLEQEAKMRNHLKAADSSGVMDEQQLGRFIQHFQRITEHSLREMPQRAQHLFKLGSDRQISQYQQR